MSDFAEELQRTIDTRRSFGGHPLWLRIREGGVSLPGLQIFAAQFFLQVREFPRAVSALHAACPFPDERRELAESLYEEETGRISGCGLPHPELFLCFSAGLGIERSQMIEAKPLRGTTAFIEGAAAITLAAEGQVPGAFGPFARDLEKHYGLSREAVAFWDVHEIADRDHSDIGRSAVIAHADTPELRDRVHQGVHLVAWLPLQADVL